MINLDIITNENNKRHWKMAIYTWSLVQNYNNWWFWIRKNKHIAQFDKKQDYHDVIDKIYLYARNLSELKYQFLIKKREDTGIKNVNNPNAFIVCSNTIDDAYEDIDNYNPKRDKLSLMAWLQILWKMKNFTL